MRFINEIFMSNVILIDEYEKFKELKCHEPSMGYVKHNGHWLVVEDYYFN